MGYFLYLLIKYFKKPNLPEKPSPVFGLFLRISIPKSHANTVVVVALGTTDSAVYKVLWF